MKAKHTRRHTEERKRGTKTGHGREWSMYSSCAAHDKASGSYKTAYCSRCLPVHNRQAVADYKGQGTGSRGKGVDKYDVTDNADEVERGRPAEGQDGYVLWSGDGWAR